MKIQKSITIHDQLDALARLFSPSHPFTIKIEKAKAKKNVSESDVIQLTKEAAPYEILKGYINTLNRWNSDLENLKSLYFNEFLPLWEVKYACSGSEQYYDLNLFDWERKFIDEWEAIFNIVRRDDTDELESDESS